MTSFLKSSFSSLTHCPTLNSSLLNSQNPSENILLALANMLFLLILITKAKRNSSGKTGPSMEFKEKKPLRQLEFSVASGERGKSSSCSGNRCLICALKKKRMLFTSISILCCNFDWLHCIPLYRETIISLTKPLFNLFATFK